MFRDFGNAVLNVNLVNNADLLSVGIAVAANVILGFVIFFGNVRSATTFLFLLQTLVLSTWSVMNYLTYRVTDLDLALLVERLVMFFAIPNSIVFLFLMHTFPESRLRMKMKYVIGLSILGITAMAVALSPFLFTGVHMVPGVIIPQPIVGPGMIIFIPAAVLTIPLGIYFLIKRYRKAIGEEKPQLRFLLIGVVLMFTLILTLNFILPAFFQNSRFIPLSAVFTLPFVIFTAYAIIKHHLLNIKVIATEILTFLMLVVTFSEVIFSQNITEIIFRSAMFVALLGFSILLIRGVRLEVQQREELQELNVKLREANTQLEELSKFKTQLLSLASHQVKAPLAVIKQFATILIDGLYGPVSDKVKETLQKMRHSSDELIALVNNLLDLRKVEEGKMDYTFKLVNLKTMIDSVIDTLQTLATEKKLTLTFEDRFDVEVNADEPKLKQVIQNFVDNAIKYTPEGHVKVSMKEDGNFIVVSVQDSGLGISAQLLPKLFDEFIRDQRIKDLIRGTGLGLYIAKKIVDAHGGQVWAESEGEGKGSTFFVRLPKVK